MTHERDDFNDPRFNLRVGDSDIERNLEIEKAKNERHVTISACWLANILAIMCLCMSYHFELTTGKPWHVPELFLMLIGTPYGGVLIKRLINATRDK